jgi:hypothetical protein
MYSTAEQYEDGAVEYAERAFDLGDEIAVSRGVDEVDPAIADGIRGDGRADRDATAALDLAGVGLGVACVDAPELTDDAGVEEQALGQAGLTRVDVRQNANVDGLRGQVGPRKLASNRAERFRVAALPRSCRWSHPSWSWFQGTGREVHRIKPDRYHTFGAPARLSGSHPNLASA